MVHPSQCWEAVDQVMIALVQAAREGSLLGGVLDGSWDSVLTRVRCGGVGSVGTEKRFWLWVFLQSMGF